MVDDYTNAYYEMLFEENNTDNIYLEKLITFGGKAYPKYGNVVIIAGGAGSGKGFQIANMLGIEGKQFDIDSLKEFVLQSEYFQKIILERFNVDISTLSLLNPTDTKTIHQIIKDLKLIPRYNEQVLNAVKESIEKPNLIFDKTCSALKDIMSVSESVQEIGYKKENIHLIWILNKYETAVIQNSERDRKVPEEILLASHIGTASVFNMILTNPNILQNFVDGDIYISFNQKDIDTHIMKTNAGKKFVTDFDYIQIKKKNEPVIPISEISQSIFDKIAEYVPTSPIKYTWKHIKDFV